MGDDFQHDATREHALTAARRAVGNIERERATKPTIFGRLALITWGCIAVVSAGFALTVALNPPGETLVAENPVGKSSVEQDVALVESVAAPDTALRPSDVDEVVTGTAQPSNLPELFGGEIGRDVSVTNLAERYVGIASRMPSLFGGLDPLIRIEEDSADLAASLVAGPFETMADARLFCRTMQLELTLDCTATSYTGETFLAR